MRASLRQVLLRSAAGLDLNFAGGVFRLNNTRSGAVAAIPGWSFSRTDTNGTATALDLAGNVIQFATGVPRITNRGILVEEARTNKLTVRNATPVSATANVTKTGDAAGVLTLENDTAALAAAGLTGVVGQVWRLNNTAGTTVAVATIDGATGNTNSHTLSAYVRGTGDVRVRLNGISNTATPLTAAYVRRTTTQTPPDSSNFFSIWVAAGGDCYFTLPQLEEGAFATSPIITTGAAGTRGADAVTMGSFVFPAAHTFVVETQAPVLQTGLFPTSFSSTGTNVGLLVTGSTNVSGANMGNATFNDVYGSAVSAGGTIKNAFRAETNNARGCLNGTLSALDATFTPVVGSQTLNIGAANGSTSYWNSYVQRIRILPTALPDAQLQALTAP
jgi:hypothetical protein